LKFEEKPNYNKLKEYFRILLKKNGLNEDGNFSWISKEYLIDYKEVNLKERKSNSQQRLMDKLLKNSQQYKQKDIKEEEEKHNIKPINSFKYKFQFHKKNSSKNFLYTNTNNNEYVYTSSNNKDIKSINEAIDIDVGDFSENEEEKPKDYNILMQSKLRKYNSEIKRKEFSNKIEKKEEDLIFPYNQNKMYAIPDKKIENIKKDYFNNIEIKNFTSFNKKSKIENNNQEFINTKNNFQRCNINKSYLINEFKSSKNNKIINNDNINTQNLKPDNYNLNINNKGKDSEFKNRSNHNTKRSKSGEKCSIQ
jgi:hypothetical protein